jgi:iron(III) transport system substrate-binding protein
LPNSLSYNEKLVNVKELKSFWDFLHPKWKGKIEVRDMRDNPAHGSGRMVFFYHHPEIGPEFIKRLFGEMDVTLFRDFRQGTDWLARGKFALCFFCRDVDKGRQQGLPIGEFGLMKEGASLSAAGYTAALLNRSGHPNAAKVFINWYLSRQGQITLMTTLANAKESTPHSLREDLPEEVVKLIPEEDRRLKGTKYFDLFRPELLDMGPIYKALNEGLAAARKR